MLFYNFTKTEDFSLCGTCHLRQQSHQSYYPSLFPCSPAIYSLSHMLSSPLWFILPLVYIKGQFRKDCEWEFKMSTSLLMHLSKCLLECWGKPEHPEAIRTVQKECANSTQMAPEPRTKPMSQELGCSSINCCSALLPIAVLAFSLYLHIELACVTLHLQKQFHTWRVLEQ